MNPVTTTKSALILLSAFLVYSLAAFIGVTAQEYGADSVSGLILSYTALTLYKLGHLPLAVAVSPLSSFAICWATSCKFDAEQRDVVAHLVAAVVFIGLCLAK